MNLIEQLNWRYAVKKMDPSKIVSDQDIDFIKEAIRLSASSYGLQPYKVLDIRSHELRARLKPFCWNQSQVTEASHLFIFCNKTSSVSSSDVDSYLHQKAKLNNSDIEQLSGYGTFVKSKFLEKSENELENWTAKQAYLALGNALIACAALKIDSTPMEGFEVIKVNELLAFNDEGWSVCLLLAIGYRSPDDLKQGVKKTRKSKNELFELRE